MGGQIEPPPASAWVGRSWVPHSGNSGGASCKISCSPPPPAPGSGVSPGRETQGPEDPLFFPLLPLKEIRAGAGWGEVAAGVPPPAKRWRTGAPLPQSGFSSKLLPWLLGEREPQGPPQRSRGAARAPPGPRAGLPPSPHPWLCGRAICPALLSGPRGGGERAKREKGDGGRGRARGDAAGRGLGPGAGQREGAGRERRGRFSTAAADSARRAERAPGRPGRGGRRRGGCAPGAAYLPRAGALAGGRAAGGQRRSALGPAGSMRRPGNCGGG